MVTVEEKGKRPEPEGMWSIFVRQAVIKMKNNAGQSVFLKTRYELSLLKNVIYEENLFLEDLKTGDMYSIFERDREEIYVNDQLQSIDIDRINDSLPIISYISMFKNIDVIDEAIKFFLRIQIVDFDKPAQDRKILVFALEKNKRQILNILKSMGIDICDINIEYTEDGKVKNVYTMT